MDEWNRDCEWNVRKCEWSVKEVLGLCDGVVDTAILTYT